VKELFGYHDVSTTTSYTHVLNRGGHGYTAQQTVLATCFRMRGVPHKMAPLLRVILRTPQANTWRPLRGLPA
jgi:hypothetical protein